MLEKLKRPALLVIDMQNDFVRCDAPLEVPSARATIPVIRGLIGKFRQAGLPIVYTRYVADDLYKPLAARFGWIDRLQPPVNACRIGFRRHYADLGTERDVIDVIDELLPQQGEDVVDKIYYSAFHGTDLGERLNARGVDGVAIVGTITEMCVEDTARHAVHYGYPTVLLADGLSSNTPQQHEATLAAFERNYGWVLRADEFGALLKLS